MKATSVVVNGERRDIFKDPITDDGVKKSAKGLVRVDLREGQYQLVDGVSEEEENKGEMKVIYRNGEFSHQVSLANIRTRINQAL
jgi:nicotinamide phosphoribosyltransferase